MSNRITPADLKSALAAHAECLEQVGVSYAGRLAIDNGSKFNGIAYRLYVIGDAGRESPPIGGDYLGMTQRDAYNALTTRTRTIYDTARALKEQTR